MNEALYCVDANAWLPCAFSLTWKIFFVGIAWSWMLPEVPRTDRHVLWNWCLRPLLSALTGVLLLLLTTLALAEAGRYTVGTETVVLIVLGLAGGGIAWRRNRAALLDHLRRSLPGLVFFWVMVCVVMLLPARGEWVLGGWDPGVYLNQGVYVERTGTFYPEASEAHSALESDEVKTFTRGRRAYRECFPAVPLDTETRTFRNYFFRLTPTLMAALQRCGGLRAATRANTVVGLLALAAFAVFLFREGKNLPHAAVSTLLLASSPVWLFHLHEPTSEMLHLLLLCFVGILFAYRERSRGAAVLCALALMALGLNRISFLPPAGMLLILFAWSDRLRTDRRRVFTERAFQVGALAFAAFFDLTATSATVVRLHKFVPILVGGCAAGIALALVLDAAASWGRTRRYLGAFPPRWRLALSVLGAAVAGFLLYGPELNALPHVFAKVRIHTHLLAPFLGAALIPCALLGVMALFGQSREKGGDRAVPLFALFFLGVGMLLLADPQVADRYPWASRRHLMYTVPALAMLAGKLLALPWEWDLRGRLRPALRALSVVALIALIGANTRRSWHAWSRTEYNGASRALATVAAQIPDEAIVVVDHPWWGTPLTFIYGKQILNGKHLWSLNKKARAEAGMQAMSRIAAGGKQVLFLTSKPEALSVYPVPIEPVELLWTSEPLVLDEIVQHPKAQDYVIRKKKMRFRLFEYQPPADQP